MTSLCCKCTKYNSINNDFFLNFYLKVLYYARFNKLYARFLVVFAILFVFSQNESDTNCQLLVIISLLNN